MHARVVVWRATTSCPAEARLLIPRHAMALHDALIAFQQHMFAMQQPDEELTLADALEGQKWE